MQPVVRHSKPDGCCSVLTPLACAAAAADPSGSTGYFQHPTSGAGAPLSPPNSPAPPPWCPAQSGLPHELDPATLDTIGETTLGAQLESPVLGAHYRVESRADGSKRWVAFSNNANPGGASVTFYEFGGGLELMGCAPAASPATAPWAAALPHTTPLQPQNAREPRFTRLGGARAHQHRTVTPSPTCLPVLQRTARPSAPPPPRWRASA